MSDKSIPLLELQDLYKKKSAALLKLFPASKNQQILYEVIIELGKKLPKPSFDIRQDAYLVEGCQSLAYLSSSIDETGRVFYQVQADALISLGLAALLLFVYQGEPVELILFCPPLFIQELGLAQNLSPGRSNGLASMYAKMKKEALPLFVQKQKETR